jgi:hypothetical protein
LQTSVGVIEEAVERPAAPERLAYVRTRIEWSRLRTLVSNPEASRLALHRSPFLDQQPLPPRRVQPTRNARDFQFAMVSVPALVTGSPAPPLDELTLLLC